MKRYKDFMEGYVPSADKKPAADGRMLPARKIKTNKPDPNKETKPTQGGLGEKMDMKKADMGDVIKDFQDSDAPQFKGKSKEKRREMAIAAKLQADDIKEEEDHIGKMEYHERQAQKTTGAEQKKHMEKAKEHRRKAEFAMRGGSAQSYKEELTGNQHKLDKNKNGKLDAADFKKLRKEQTEMNEEMMTHDHAKEVANSIAKSHKNLKVTSHGNSHFVHHKDEEDGANIHVHAKDGHIHVDHEDGQHGSESKHKSVAAAVAHGKKVGGLSEEMTPAQKAARLQLIKKVSAKMNKRAEMDAKRAMRRDPVLGRRKSDPADHDLVHKEDTHVVKYHDSEGKHKNDSKPMTLDKARAHAAKGNAVDKVGGKYTIHKINEGGPGSGRISAKNVKMGVGIARDKRYAGGNMTGATKVMDKIKKGLADHPRVKDELRKQNEDAKTIKEDNEMEKKEMMKTQLHFIKYAADEICEYIDMGGEIEEWYQNKVSKAYGDFESLHSYMEGTARKDGLKEELDSQESDVDYDKKPTFAEFISKLNK